MSLDHLRLSSNIIIREKRVKKITLNMKDENMDTVMHILTNLKAGLIESINDKPLESAQKTSYTPKHGRIIDESEKPLGKYASSAVYKSRLKKNL